MPRDKTKILMKIIERLNYDGLNDSDISKVVHVSACYVATLRKRMGIPPIRKHRNHKKQKTEEVMVIIKKLNAQKKSDADIARDLGVSRQYIHQLRHTVMGLPAWGKSVTERVGV